MKKKKKERKKNNNNNNNKTLTLNTGLYAPFSQEGNKTKRKKVNDITLRSWRVLPVAVAFEGATGSCRNKPRGVSTKLQVRGVCVSSSSTWVCFAFQVPTRPGEARCWCCSVPYEACGARVCARVHPGAVQELAWCWKRRLKRVLALLFSPPAARSVTQFP